MTHKPGFCYVRMITKDQGLLDITEQLYTTEKGMQKMAFATRCRTNVVEILQSSTLQGVQYAQSHKSSF